MCVRLYRHGTVVVVVVVDFGIMNTIFIRAVSRVCREDPWHIFICVSHGHFGVELIHGMLYAVMLVVDFVDWLLRLLVYRVVIDLIVVYVA